MVIEKIPTTTLRQQVYLQLRSLIQKAELLPGQTITLRQLADSFGVSIAPVRDAVWQLASDRVLVVEDNKRVLVNSLSAEEFGELLELRILLEGKAAIKACLNPRPKPIETMQGLLTRMEDSVSGNFREYIQANDEFHNAIYTHADSPVLLDLIVRFKYRVNPYIYLHAVIEHDLSAALECHRQMLSSFVTGDAMTLVSAIKQDLEGAAAIILPELRHRLPGVAKG
ncbi:MAG: GntR family transcriptional regulator [Desulfopila sp.]